MKIDKAIEILTPLTKPGVLYNSPEIKDALKLGIEALKELQRCRPYCQFDPAELLPGETKD